VCNVPPQHHDICSKSPPLRSKPIPSYLQPAKLIEAFTDNAHLLIALDGSTFGLNLIFPIGNLAHAALVGLNTDIVDCRDGHFVHYPGSIYAYGGPILYLCLQIGFLFWLLNRLETRQIHKHSFPLFPRSTHTTAEVDEEQKSGSVTDQDVVQEKIRVEAAEDDLLRVLGVAKSFGKLRAVDNVSFGISGGEILALLGPNGAGKSTIINMVRGELSPDNGRILLQGIDMEKQTRIGQRYIGCMPTPFPFSSYFVYI
jgi:ATP-binding cassette, subfamily A (ABC1), member 3